MGFFDDLIDALQPEIGSEFPNGSGLTTDLATIRAITPVSRSTH